MVLRGFDRLLKQVEKVNQDNERKLKEQEQRKDASEPQPRTQAVGERNLLEEIDYLSGSLLAHEEVIKTILATLVAQDLIAKDDLRQLFVELAMAHEDQPEYPKFIFGYEEVIEDLDEYFQSNS